MPSFRVTVQHRDVTSSSNQLTYGKSNLTYTTTGYHEDRRVLSIGTSEESFTISTDIGDAGICYLENLDATNYVSVGFSTGVYGIRLGPSGSGIPAQFALEPATATIYLLANTASCNVKIHVAEA